MTAPVTFQIPATDLAKLRAVLAPKQFRQAVFQAIRRTTTQGERIAAKAVTDRMTLARKYVRGKHRRAAIKSRVSRGEIPEGRIEINRVRLPLSAFKMSVSKAQGVTVTPDKNLAPIRLRHAFVANVASSAQAELGVSHRGVFQRRKIGGAGMVSVGRQKFTPRGFAWRLPIDERLGPTVLDFVRRDEIEAAVLKEIGDALRRNVDSQVARFTKGQFKSLDDAFAALAGPSSGGEAEFEVVE